MIKNEKYVSGLDKILTADVWNKYFEQKCLMDFKFVDSFIESMHHYNEKKSLRRIVAGSFNAYKKFHKFFLNCLEYFGNEMAEAYSQ